MSTKISKNLSTVFLICVLCAVPLTATADLFEQFGVARPRTTKPAPNFVLKDINGQTISLEQLKGKPILLNFWATWCGACKEEMPSMQRLHNAAENNGGFHVIAISIDRSNLKKIDRYVKKLKLDFPILLDPDQTIRKSYFIRGLPTSYLIDSDGKLQGFVSGARNWDSPESLELMKSLN